jgi:hypothetical protein
MAHGANGQNARRTATQHARAVSGGVDLSKQRMTDEQAQHAQEDMELQLGLRCGGCGRRVGMGFRFKSFDVRSDMPIVQLIACVRDDCDFAEQARVDADVMEMVEYAWTDENGVDAPAAQTVAEAHAAAAEREKAATDAVTTTISPLSSVDGSPSNDDGGSDGAVSGAVD